MKKVMLVLLAALSLAACKKEIEGCRDRSALNYDPDATKSDGSCMYPAPTPAVILGCTDPTSTNFNPSATQDDGSCKYEGQLLFWTNANGGYQIKVTVDGKDAYITQFYSATDPTCGSSGCALFKLSPGTYNFYAAEVGGTNTWSGQRTVVKNDCTKMCLLQ